MPWVRVVNYSLGLSVAKKQFSLYYTLQGANATTQIFLSPTQFSALSDLFRNGDVVNYNTDGNYFATEPHPM